MSTNKLHFIEKRKLQSVIRVMDKLSQAITTISSNIASAKRLFSALKRILVFEEVKI